MSVFRRGFTLLSRLLDRQFLWVLIAIYVLAALVPGPGRWLCGRTLGEFSFFGEPVRFALPMLLLAALLWNAGLEVPLGQLINLLRRPTLLVVGLIANLAVPLVFLMGVAQVMRLWHDLDEVQTILVGLGLIAAMPIAGSATAWTRKANGNLALILGLVVCSTFLSPLTTPLVLSVVSVLAGEPAAVLQNISNATASIFLVLCVLLPSLLGMGTLWLAGRDRVARIRPGLKLANSVVLLLLIYINAAASFGPMLSRLEADFVLAMLGIAVSFCVVAFAAGWLVARLFRADSGEQSSLMFGLGMNNNGTGMVLASVALVGQPQVLLLIVCYNLMQHLVAAGVEHLRTHSPALFAPTAERGEWLPWRLTLRPFLSFSFLLLAGVIVVNACGSYWNIRTLAATNSLVVHTHQVITRIQETLSLLKDAETGQRGYLITGDARYLEPFYPSAQAIHTRFRQLKELTGDNANQRERIAVLERLTADRFAELDLTILLYKNQGFEAARRVVLEDRGKKNMDAIRQLMADMEKEEQDLLEMRTAAADLRIRRALATVVLLTGLMLVYVFVRRLFPPKLSASPKSGEPEERGLAMSNTRQQLLLGLNTSTPNREEKIAI